MLVEWIFGNGVISQKKTAKISKKFFKTGKKITQTKLNNIVVVNQLNISEPIPYSYSYLSTYFFSFLARPRVFRRHAKGILKQSTRNKRNRHNVTFILFLESTLMDPDWGFCVCEVYLRKRDLNSTAKIINAHQNVFINYTCVCSSKSLLNTAKYAVKGL